MQFANFYNRLQLADIATSSSNFVSCQILPDLRLKLEKLLIFEKFEEKSEMLEPGGVDGRRRWDDVWIANAGATAALLLLLRMRLLKFLLRPLSCQSSKAIDDAGRRDRTFTHETSHYIIARYIHIL